jgi:large subunit ribosomal protein L21
MYAFVETCGSQFKVSTGDSITVPMHVAEPGAEITIGKVLAVVREDGAVFGSPYVENASVTAEVVECGRSKKVLVFKKKPRKGFKCLRGHRQDYTKLRIKEIQGVQDGS